MKKIIFYCPLFLDRTYFDFMNNFGYEIIFVEDEKKQLDIDEKSVFGVICNNFFVYHDIRSFCNIEFIHLTSAGTDKVDMDYITSHKIKLFNAQNVYSIPISEFVVSNILYVYKSLEIFRKNQQNRVWKKERLLYELNKKRVCIVGCGGIGCECAKRLKPFGCEIYGVDVVNKSSSLFDKVFLPNDLANVVSFVDIIIICVPLNKTTLNMFDYTLLNACKNGSILVNVSRGPIINEKALISLHNKFLQIVLDVFETEPLDSNSKLWGLNNVLVSPHNSYIGEGNADRLSKLIKSNLINFFEK